MGGHGDREARGPESGGSELQESSRWPCPTRPVQLSSSDPTAELGASVTLTLVGDCSESRGKGEAERD